MSSNFLFSSRSSTKYSEGFITCNDYLSSIPDEFYQLELEMFKAILLYQFPFWNVDGIFIDCQSFNSSIQNNYGSSFHKLYFGKNFFLSWSAGIGKNLFKSQMSYFHFGLDEIFNIFGTKEFRNF